MAPKSPRDDGRGDGMGQKHHIDGRIPVGTVSRSKASSIIPNSGCVVAIQLDRDSEIVGTEMRKKKKLGWSQVISQVS